ncbi:MAG: PDZ domain-containing protein [Acidobacteriota bacterium]|nr:PDZ domain-containing protein [Acidobacteriota bacterium]
MKLRLVVQRLTLALLVAASATVFAQTQPPDYWCPARGVAYGVSLKHAAEHMVHVDAVTRQPVGELQLPVWNALYQVRDFAVNVDRFEAYEGVPMWICDGCDALEARARKVNKSAWQFQSTGDNPCLTFSYDIHLDDPGPFGASASPEFSFFNWAEVLVYRPDERSAPVSVRLLDVPAAVSLRDGGVFGARTAEELAAPASAVATAPSYDRLVDAPAMLGKLYETSFVQDHTTYHLAVDSPEVDLATLGAMLRRITAAGNDWMHDHPCADYTFLFLVAHGSGRGGMEHACATTIDIPLAVMQQNVANASGISAHEFFHSWNVKRIRPRSLEPVDYTREQDSTALWFSEGVTSTVADILQSRAGINDERQALAQLAQTIGMLQSRPAHRTQSAEQSSLETWFDGYAAYRRPERSISYYTKGEVLGFLIDLEMRRLTNGHRSLRDLFLSMNRDAKAGVFFDDSEGVRVKLQELTGNDFRDFFTRYVSGTDEIPYDKFFSYVGLHLAVRATEQSYPGFTVARPMGRGVAIVRVDDGSPAAQAGLHAGDQILEADGKPARNFQQALRHHDPHTPLHLKIANPAGATRELDLAVLAHKIDEYQLEDVAGVTPAQMQHRRAFLRGDSEAE